MKAAINPKKYVDGKKITIYICIIVILILIAIIFKYNVCTNTEPRLNETIKMYIEDLFVMCQGNTFRYDPRCNEINTALEYYRSNFIGKIINIKLNNKLPVAYNIDEKVMNFVWDNNEIIIIKQPKDYYLKIKNNDLGKINCENAIMSYKFNISKRLMINDRNIYEIYNEDLGKILYVFCDKENIFMIQASEKALREYFNELDCRYNEEYSQILQTCKNGETHIQQCNGEIITTAICTNQKWLDTGINCPIKLKQVI